MFVDSLWQFVDSLWTVSGSTVCGSAVWEQCCQGAVSGSAACGQCPGAGRRAWVWGDVWGGLVGGGREGELLYAHTACCIC